MATFKRSIWEREIRSTLFAKAKILPLLRNDFFKGEEDYSQTNSTGQNSGGAFYGGENVYFPKRGSLNVNDYQQATGVTIQDITTTDTPVAIDKHKEITFSVTDIQRVQANSELRSGYTEDVGEKLRAAIEMDFFTALNNDTGIDTVNITHSDPTYQELLAIQTTLDTGNVPETDRYLVVSPELDAIFRQLKNGSGGTSVYVEADPESVKTGITGYLAGFQVIKTNNLPSGVDGFAFHKNAAGLAYNWDVRVETWRDGKYKRDIVSADARYGIGILEPDFALKVILV